VKEGTSSSLKINSKKLNRVKKWGCCPAGDSRVDSRRQAELSGDVLNYYTIVGLMFMCGLCMSGMFLTQ